MSRMIIWSGNLVKVQGGMCLSWPPDSWSCAHVCVPLKIKTQIKDKYPSYFCWHRCIYQEDLISKMLWITVFISLPLKGKHMLEVTVVKEWWKLFSDLEPTLIHSEWNEWSRVKVEWNPVQKVVRSWLFSSGRQWYQSGLSRLRREEDGARKACRGRFWSWYLTG